MRTPSTMIDTTLETHRIAILRVAVFCTLKKCLDYLPPLDQCPLVPGVRVLVPFRKTQKVGVVIEITHQSDCPVEKLKPIAAVLDPEPRLSPKLLELIHWTASYYHVSLAEVLQAALPSPLKKESHTTSKKRTPKIPPSSAADLSDTPALHPPLILNAAQQQAVDAVQRSQGSFKPFLLEGVTGSGKTEVYSCLIEQALALQQQTLILVPEIGLTPQLLDRFKNRFQVPIAVYHSGLSATQRLKAWEAARLGEAPIIIGTRSAALMPLKNPGLFIIDEEHDASLKQQEGFRYHARDVLMMRAKLDHCPIVLGSATPSLETLYNAQKGRYQILSLPLRAATHLSPTLQVLDTRHKQLDKGFSATLLQAITQHLSEGNQVLLFLNRRGFSPVLMCIPCRWISQCTACAANMTVHYAKQTLECHHCERVIPLPTHCPSCHKEGLEPVGLGTERLEAFLQNRFPDHKVLRIDRDSTRKKGSMQAHIDSMHKGEADLLLGTQMIAKGHHFPNVTLVAILDIDQALFSSDFRSIEKMGQLITQVAGRTGRAEKPGQVLLQTQNPHHPMLRQLLEKGFASFSTTLLTERQSLGLPPYSYQVLIRAEAKTFKRAEHFLNLVKIELQSIRTNDLECMGPIPAPMEKRQGLYRAQLLLQSNKRSNLHMLLHQLMPKIQSFPIAQKMRWSLDVDPIDLY